MSPTSAPAPPLPESGRGHVDRRIGVVLAVVAATLAVGSFVHLGGYTPRGTKPPFDADDAGIAEAVIAAVLAWGAVDVLRAGGRARLVALGTTGFAILGFLVGLSETARGGDLADLVYHLVTLPVLVVVLVVLVRTPGGTAGDERPLG